MFPNITLSSQGIASLQSLLVSSVEGPLGAIHTPIILEAWEGGSRLIFCLPSGEDKET